MHGLFLVAAAIGAALYYVMALSFLVGVAFLIAEHGLEGAWASVVVVHGRTCPMAYGIFPDEELNPCPLHCRWIFNHWTTREVLDCVFFEIK